MALDSVQTLNALSWSKPLIRRDRDLFGKRYEYIGKRYDISSGMSSGCARGNGDRIPRNSGLFMVVGVVRVGGSSFGYIYAVRRV